MVMISLRAYALFLIIYSHIGCHGFHINASYRPGIKSPRSRFTSISLSLSSNTKNNLSSSEGRNRNDMNYQNDTKQMLTIDGPPEETRPDYENIHGPLGKLPDKLFLTIFRSKMAEKVGVDSKLPKDDYGGLMELTAALNARYSDRRQVQQIAQEVLRSLFPSWLPGRFAVMFAKPFPKFSSRMNAWATRMAGTWLMGECELNDCEIDGGGIGKNQGVLVKRCRYLEDAKCASICVNSCKIPTQNFFIEDMGLPLTMTPDYETGECQFSFGLTPDERSELDAKNTPCFSKCPSSGGLRSFHTGNSNDNPPQSILNSKKCNLMDNDDP